MSAAENIIPEIEQLKVHSEITNTQLENADSVRRVAAFVVDTIITGSILILSKSIFLKLISTQSKVALLANLFVITFYWILPTYAFGKTLGKKMLNIKVVDLQGEENLSFGQTFMRETFCRSFCLFTFGWGYIRALYRSDKMGFHDTLSKTRVVVADRK